MKYCKTLLLAAIVAGYILILMNLHVIIDRQTQLIAKANKEARAAFRCALRLQGRVEELELQVSDLESRGMMLIEILREEDRGRVCSSDY